MKRSKKITTFIIIFFLIIALIIIGRYAMGLYFKKKFSKRPPPGVGVEIVSSKNFSQSLESYCTSLSSKTSSYKIKKNELLEPINFNKKVNKGDVIAKLTSKTIAAPFAGIIGKRGISGSSLGSENTIILTLDDSKKILDEKFKSLGQIDNNVVFSCGSSVTASVLGVAYSLINNKYMPTIYIGSWSEYGKK